MNIKQKKKIYIFNSIDDTHTHIYIYIYISKNIKINIFIKQVTMVYFVFLKTIFI